MTTPEGPQRLVGDLMSSDVVTLGRNDQLGLADDVMRLGRIRHLPVVDEDDRLVGIVSQRDLFRGALARALGFGDTGQRKILSTVLVKEVMSEDPLTTTPSTPLADAARIMLSRKVGALPVLDGERLVGILTEADFVALASRS